MRRPFRKLVVLSILAALLIHLGLLGLLGLRSTTPPEPEPTPTMSVALTQVEPPQAPGESPKINERELAQQIDNAMRRLQNFSIEQNLRTLRENTRWLDRNSSEQAVSEIAAIVRRATGAAAAGDRAYAPAENPPPGEFDHRSMLPYSTAKITGPDGLERTEQTWVDKAGRSMKQTVRRETLPDGKTRYFHGVYQPDGKLFEYETDHDPLQGVGSVLETVSQSPLLQQLFRETVLPALETKRRAAAAESPARP